MPFAFEELAVAGVVLVRPRVFRDDRGAFLETHRSSDFRRSGLPESFVQDNLSVSRKDVVRGLHFQRAPKAQGKLVSVVRGRIWDVAVDIRRESSTFLRWVGVELDADEHAMLYVPPGFAHGFAALTEEVVVSYKCTQEYDPVLDDGVRWDDPRIGVRWPVSGPILSDKDAMLPFVDEIESASAR